LIGPKEETDANRFASNLLMPRELVQAEWEARNRDKSPETIEGMARLLKVSKQSMYIRLGLANKPLIKNQLAGGKERKINIPMKRKVPRVDPFTQSRKKQAR